MEDIERTVGLAILPLRPHRLKVTLAYSELASELGVPSLSTHLGFFPRDVGHADYLSLVADLRTVANGLGVAILSTPKGVMSDARAREENVGGEVLCYVW